MPIGKTGLCLRQAQSIHTMIYCFLSLRPSGEHCLHSSDITIPTCSATSMLRAVALQARQIGFELPTGREQNCSRCQAGPPAQRQPALLELTKLRFYGWRVGLPYRGSASSGSEICDRTLYCTKIWRFDDSSQILNTGPLTPSV